MDVLEIIAKKGSLSFRELVEIMNIKDEELGDFYGSLCLNSKIFLTEEGKWDLKSKHKFEEFECKVELEEEETEENEEEQQEEENTADFPIFDDEEC